MAIQPPASAIDVGEKILMVDALDQLMDIVERNLLVRKILLLKILNVSARLEMKLLALP